MASSDAGFPVSARSEVRRALSAALAAAGVDAPAGKIQLERPGDPSHGDLSANIALTTAKELGRRPRELAAEIVAALDLDERFMEKIEVAGPGFINFTFAGEYLAAQTARIVELGSRYGDSDLGGGRKLQVEFVSANPTGPLVIVSARSAAVGSAIAAVLRKAGYDVETEYYLNDAGSQVDKLGRSTMVRFRQRLGEDLPFPEDGYPGEYLVDVAGRISEVNGRSWLKLPEADAVRAFGDAALEHMIAWIKADLERFGVRFDRFFRESDLHVPGGPIEQTLSQLDERGTVYEKDGARWFRSTDYGDEKDRVLVRSDGSPTYFLADAAYHRDKLSRGYGRVIDIFGPDHHGHIARLKAASVVLGAAPDWLEVLTVQWVRLIEDGRQVKMSKRGGEFETLADLVEDVGADASKFFFLMRRTEAHLDFNLTLARTQGDENPVYYVQYAHARICSVVSFAREEGVAFPDDTSCVGLLREPEEIALMRELVIFPQLIESIAETCEPHRLTAYGQQLAAAFHKFYHVCRIVSNDRRLSEARLLLAEATRTVLAETLRLLGISAPERM